MRPGPSEIDVAVLCGGLGKRLREKVPDRPKPMALVAGRPFLDILIEYVSGFGFRRFILCAGYMADMIEEHYRGRRDAEFVVSREDGPLGTGGAIKNAEGLIKSGDFMVLNGDSICDMDMSGFAAFHFEKDALASVALVAPEKEADYGAVAVDGKGRITSFTEKSVSRAYINAGVYLFKREVLGLIPRGKKYSLEEELFPSILDREVYGYATGARLIDIGTAERYERAQGFISALLQRRP